MKNKILTKENASRSLHIIIAYCLTIVVLTAGIFIATESGFCFILMIAIFVKFNIKGENNVTD